MTTDDLYIQNPVQTHFLGIATHVREPMPDEIGDIRFVLRIGGESVVPHCGDTFLWDGDLYLYDGREAVPLGAGCFTEASGDIIEPKESVPKGTNCRNCGAPLAGQHLCRYCDTWNH